MGYNVVVRRFIGMVMGNSGSLANRRRWRESPCACEALEGRCLLTAGLTGQYYDSADLTSLKLTRVDTTVDFNWGSSTPDPTIAANSYSVAWTGQVQPLVSEVYTFHVTADDGVRLWVDHRLVAENWTNHSATETVGQMALTSGQWYDIRLEYYQNTGSASVQLAWSSPSQSKQVIPSTQLSSTVLADDRGSIQQEIWTGIAGGNITSLTSIADYPSRPTGREYLLQFESLQSNWADNYGQRIRGYLVPPAGGNYVLAISGDEQTQLYLSTDADPAHKVLVASSTQPTAFRDFSAYASQKSAAIMLTAGVKYYIEALHKEGTGGDHVSVAWQPPGQTQLAVIPGDVLIPFGTDTATPAQGSFLATLARGRPRLLSTPQRFEWLKQQVAQAGQMQTWYNSIKSAADSYLTAALPQYVPDNRGTILGISRSVVDHVYRLAMVWRVSGDSRYAERAWAELEAAANFPDWHPAHFLDTAEMTHAFAIGYDWLYDYWTVARRSTLSAAIVSKGLNQALPLYRANSSWVRSSSNNWNLVCNGGMVLGALAIAEDQPALVEEILAKALPSAAAIMRHFTSDAGGWYEGPGYWDYSTSYNARMLSALENSLGSDFGLGRTPGLSETGDFAVYITGPTGLSFNFADASAGRIRGAQMFYYTRRYNRPSLAWYERTWGSATPMDLLWYDTRGGDFGSTPQPTDIHWRGGSPSSYSTQDAVVLRNSWNDTNTAFAGFKAGKVGDSHGNLDAGSFVFDALGQRWAYDLGGDDYALPGYFGSQRWDYYRMRAEGHNTLVINPGSGADQILSSVPKVLRQESSPERAISIADLTAAYSGASRVWRGLSLDRRTGSLLVQDEIEMGSPSTVWWFMHVKLDASQVQISDDGTSATLTSNGQRLWVKIINSPGARLTLMDAMPLPTSPNPAGQNANTAYRKLAIQMNAVTNRRLAVWLVPLPPGKNPPAVMPAITPLVNWTAGSLTQAWAGDVDGYQPGGAVDVDPAWQSQVLAATGLLAGTFDSVAANRALPFTFNYTIPAGLQVIGASLNLGLRSTGDSSADRLYVESMSQSSLYSELGWAAVSNTPTSRSLDLGRWLSRLQDGVLNLAVTKNTALDWASLSLRFGPTGQYNTATLTSEADAFVRDGSYAGSNFGTGDIVVKRVATADTGYTREGYLRFDVSAISGNVVSAFVRLVPTGVSDVAENQLAFVADDTWTETTLNWNNRPAASGGILGSWTPQADVAQLVDVTSLVQAAIAGDDKLSLRISCTTTAGNPYVTYASRENANTALRPQLIITTLGIPVDGVLRVDGDGRAPLTADNIRLVANDGYVSVFINNATDIPDIRRDLGTLQQVLVRTLEGDDLVTVDGLGVLNPPAGLSIDTGNGSDILNIASGAVATWSGAQLLVDSVAVNALGAESLRLGVGALNVTAGSLSLGPGSSLSPLTDLTVSGGGTLDLGTASVVADAVTLVDGQIVNGSLSGTVYTVQNGLVSANLGGTAKLTKNTTGKVVLSGNNTYTGTTTIYQGILNIRSGTALGAGLAAVTISCDGATSRFSTLELEGPDFTIDKPISTTGNGVGGIGAIRNIGGNHTFSGPITLTSGGGGSTYQSDAGILSFTADLAPNTTSRSLTLQGAGNGLISGGIHNGLTVNLPLTKTGSGTWTLAGNNTYTGTTTVSAGRLVISGSLVPGTMSVSGGATATFAASQQLNSLSVSANGTVAIQAGAGVVLRLTSLTLSGSGSTQARLDLADGAAVLPSTTYPYNTLRNLVRTGMLTGRGIFSSAGTSTAPAAVGLMDNSIIRQTTFGGVVISDGIDFSQSILKGTRVGDGNNDGKVDQQDYLNVIAHMGRTGATYFEGDLNLDGVVTANDLAEVSAHLGAGTSPVAGPLLPVAQSSLAVTAMPTQPPVAASPTTKKPVVKATKPLAHSKRLGLHHRTPTARNRAK